MKTHIANIITGIRILGSILLAFVPVFSAVYYTVYLTCGLSDMADGMIARKTNNVSSFGARFDTAADFLFAAVCTHCPGADFVGRVAGAENPQCYLILCSA